MKKFGILLIVVVILLFGGEVFGESLMFLLVSPPTRTDGTPLTNLAGYKLYWGPSSTNYTNSVTVTYCRACPSPATQITEQECLPFGPATTYYFAATAFDTNGNESGYSNEVSWTTKSATKPLGNCALSPSSSLCRVDGYDLIFLNKQLGKTILGPACSQTNYTVWKTIEAADLNYDGIIDGSDKAILSAGFGQACSSCPCP